MICTFINVICWIIGWDREPVDWEEDPLASA